MPINADHDSSNIRFEIHVNVSMFATCEHNCSIVGVSGKSIYKEVSFQ